MSDTKKINLEAFAGLSEAEKALAIEILKQYAKDGKSEILEDLKYSDFEEIPVDIMTFISEDRYLGRGLWIVDEYTGERKCTVFPYWIEKLKEIFPDNLTTRYNTIVLTGSIGLGKSFIAVVCQLYLLYRMMCLKDPYTYYGLQPIDKITFSMLNVTLEAAQGVGWDKMQQLLQSSEWFMSRGNLNASRTNPQWQPPKGIELIFGSSNRHVVGRALFSNFSDEVNFGVGNNVEKQKAKLKKMISQIDARMISRFGKGTYLPTMNIIASSKDSEQAFMESYIEMKRQNESKTTLIVDEPQWVVRNDKGSPDDPGSFYVAVGNKFLAHELLPVGATEEEVDSYREKGYFMLKVPPIYREAFEDNLDLALTDNAGISTSSSTKYISGVRLNQAKVDDYRNPFTKDIIEVGNSPDDYLQYANFFDLSAVSPNDLSRPLFIHLDMSLSGDKTGIAGVWITGKRPTQVGELPSKELEFKLAFSVSVKAPKGFQVSFEKNRNFIRWLKDRGFAVKGVSSDTYQSAQIQQQLKADGFHTKILSVDRVDSDRTCKPYAFLKSAIYERHIKIYKKCDLLTDELTSLERLSDGHIDHPKNFCFTGDTKVALVDGRTLNFLDLIKEYQNGKTNYVYSMNLNTKQIEAKPITKAWQTLKNQKLIKITLDNGEEIKCTYNHKFMLRNGEYIEAQDLLPNDSLMPLYTKTAEKGLKGYRLVYSPFEDMWHYEHRQFAEEIFDEKYLVHHKDCNPLNNRPDNLVWMSKTAHMNEHYRLQTGAQSEEANTKRKLSLKAWHEENKNTDDYKARNEKLRIASTTTGYNKKLEAMRASHIAEIEAYYDIRWNDLTLSEKDSYAQKFARVKDSTLVNRIAEKVKERHQAGGYKKAYSAMQKVNIHKKQLKELFPVVDTKKFIEFFGFDYYSIDTSTKAGASKKGVWINRYRQKMYEILNHKVAKIEYLDECEDVYDIEVVDNHNFALAAGIFVHNSKDQADAVCGATYLASEFAEEYSYSYGDNLIAGIDVSLESSESLRKTQLILDFQEDLKKAYTEVYAELDAAEERERQQRQAEYERYRDIADGIIII